MTIRPQDITDGLKRLRGETPSGRMFAGERDGTGRMIYRDLNAAEPDRPKDWRAKQTKPMRDMFKW